MTYSRHYPRLAHVHDALGGDLARTVEFFRKVDRMRPTEAAIMKKHRIKSATSLEFIRAYEEAVIDTIERALAQSR
jgi:hypothetical protein